MFNVALLTPILQTLMTSTADQLAEDAELIKRHGKYTGAELLQALTFGFLKRRDAPLEDLAQPLGVSRQALDQRLDQSTTADFCRRCRGERCTWPTSASPTSSGSRPRRTEGCTP